MFVNKKIGETMIRLADSFIGCLCLFFNKLAYSVATAGNVHAAG